MYMQAQLTSFKRWTWFTEVPVWRELSQEGDNGHHQSEQNQSENDGPADFILFRFCVVVV